MGRADKREPSRLPSVRARRERLGHERPGTVLRGPQITVGCECGERRGLFYGERWTCDCGRTWDTRQIPAEQYRQIRRTQRRFRVLPVGLGLLVASSALFFIATGNVFSVFFLLPGALTAWFVLLRPAHRRRYAAAIERLPRWTLRPE